MNDYRRQAQSSRLSGGQGKRGPVSGNSTPQIHGCILETLLAAAVSEDELVINLLQASLRSDRARTLKLARAIAEHRGVHQENAAPVAGECHAARKVRYEDKLLAAIHREEILIESLIAASARDDRPTLFSICRDLAKNRKSFDLEFRRNTIKPEEPSFP
jgi:hypothetical protein